MRYFRTVRTFNLAPTETTKALVIAQKQWLEEIWEALPIAEVSIQVHCYAHPGKYL